MQATVKRLEYTKDGHNKFYELITYENGTWAARYGKIGSQGVMKEYPNSEYIKKLSEKLRKGYVEVSNRTCDMEPITSGSPASKTPYTGVIQWGTM